MSSRKTNRIITGPERNMVLRVLKFFEKEKLYPRFALAKGKVVKRTSLATGVSISSIKRIRREEQQIKVSLGNPDEDSEVSLPTPGSRRKRQNTTVKCSKKIINGLRTIIDSYQQAHNRMMPLKEIFVYAKEELNFPGQKETLRKILVDKLGYVFESSKPNNLEDEKLMAQSEISSVFLETSIKVELGELIEGNIKTERVDIDEGPEFNV